MKKNFFASKNSSRISLAWIGFAIMLFAILAFFFFFSSSTVPSPACENIDRSSYRISPDVFSGLPIPPACFHTIVDAYHVGTFSDSNFFTPSYYLQPEFFPNFESQGLQAWTIPDATHWGAVGFGVFPPEQKFTLSSGDSLSVRFFMHSGYGVRTFQGVRLLASPTRFTNVNAPTLELSPELEQGFILGPTFPKFDSQWVHPVDFVIKTLPYTPAGTYQFNLLTDTPLSSVRDSLAAQYGPNYYDATSYVGRRIVATVEVVIRSP